MLTLDASHSCPKTARLILDEGADYVLPVKGNHKTLREDIAAFDRAPAAETLDKGHGRLEERTCQLVPLDEYPDDLAALPGRRQALLTAGPHSRASRPQFHRACCRWAALSPSPKLAKRQR